MKKTKRILSIILILISIMCLLSLTIISFIYGLKSTEKNEFWGGVFGAAISIIFSFVILSLTIQANNKQQIKSVNKQTSIQIEDNLRQKYINEKANFKEAYNALEIFLFNSKTFVIDSNQLSITLDKLNATYADYRKCINTLTITTGIYELQDKCIGCTLCHIKIYGEVIRELKELQILVESIEELAGEVNTLQNSNFRIVLNSHNMKQDDNKIQTKVAKIEEQNEKITEKLNKLETLKLKLFNAIKRYFQVVNIYIQETVLHIEKFGKINEQCKKMEFLNKNY